MNISMSARKLILACAILAAIAIALRLPWPRTPMVYVSTSCFETNSSGEVCAVVMITNTSRKWIGVGLRVLTNGPAGWMPTQTAFESPSWEVLPLRQGTFRLPMVPPAERWRLEAQCRPVYFGRRKRLMNILDQVFARSPKEYYFLSAEMLPNHPAAPNTGIASPLTIEHH